MTRTQKEVVRAVQAHLRAMKRTMTTDLAQRAQLDPSVWNEEIANIQVAQNVLRTCMEAVVQELIPFSEITPAELAIRLASYAISIAPLETQDAILDNVLRVLPAAHSKRLANGIIIKTDWRTNGLDQPNVPGGRA